MQRNKTKWKRALARRKRKPPSTSTSTTTSSTTRVSVYIRVRPLIDTDPPSPSSPSTPTFTFPSTTSIAVASRRFTFDHVFPPATAQSTVFDTFCRPVLDDAIMGYNATIFAYGQTGSGKTHTMFGEPSALGLIPRAANYVFDELEARSSTVSFTIHASVVEIYMEQLSDLATQQQSLQIREDTTRGVYIQDLSKHRMQSPEDLLQFIHHASSHRATRRTKLNAASSRSHTVVMLYIKQRLRDSSTRRCVVNFADLAGSERLERSEVTNTSASEAKQINLSLTYLGRCINALAERAAAPQRGTMRHIPYRDSKLTFLLKHSLGGNAKTALIVCCSPHSDHSDETLSSLNFASRAMSVQNRAHVNAYIDHNVQELRATIKQLRKKLAKRDRTIAELRAQLDAQLDASPSPPSPPSPSTPPELALDPSIEYAEDTFEEDKASIEHLLDDILTS